MAVFIIFNVIIITIFFESFYHRSYIPVSTPAHKVHDQDFTEEAEQHDDDQDYNCDDDDDYSDDDEYYHGSDGYDEDVKDDDNDDDSDDDNDNWLLIGFEDQEDHTDLWRRSEEFIAKINEKWREELRNDRLLHAW